MQCRLIMRGKLNSNRLKPVHLYVIEGTASIFERQRLRESRTAGEKEVWQRGKERRLIFKIDQKKGNDSEHAHHVLTESVVKSKHTQFPTLRFALQNSDMYLLIILPSSLPPFLPPLLPSSLPPFLPPSFLSLTTF